MAVMTTPADTDARPLIVVEDDPFLRLLPVILDPDAPAEMMAAFADFMAHDEPDFVGWCNRLRAEIPGLWPARVRLIETVDELRSALPQAKVVVVESLAIGAEELAAAPHLRCVQKYGALPRSIDVAACAARRIEVLTIRRRANIACAEHAFALILALARKLNTHANVLSKSRLGAAGHKLVPFDRHYTPNGNWARVPGLVSLHGSTMGIIGLGEIGREIATRARAFEMRVVYHQRTRLPPAEEHVLRATYLGLDDLLATSDWIVPQLPATPETRHLLDAARLARIKPGTRIVNVSRPDAIDRAAAIEALRTGRLGGLGLDPPYEAPGREGDELLEFDNVIVTPHFAGSPRHNALDDFEEMIKGLAREISP